MLTITLNVTAAAGATNIVAYKSLANTANNVIIS